MTKNKKRAESRKKRCPQKRAEDNLLEEEKGTAKEKVERSRALRTL